LIRRACLFFSVQQQATGKLLWYPSEIVLRHPGVLRYRSGSETPAQPVLFLPRNPGKPCLPVLQNGKKLGPPNCTASRLSVEGFVDAIAIIIMPTCCR
jgi:hypothetical protein